MDFYGLLTFLDISPFVHGRRRDFLISGRLTEAQRLSGRILAITGLGEPPAAPVGGFLARRFFSVLKNIRQAWWPFTGPERPFQALPALAGLPGPHQPLVALPSPVRRFQALSGAYGAQRR